MSTDDYQLGEMLKIVNKVKKYGFKSPPCERSLYEGIKELVSTFAFERELENTTCVEKKIEILRHNKELLIFDLPTQLTNFKNWWTNNYTLEAARIQCVNEEECESGLTHQHKLSVPFLEHHNTRLPTGSYLCNLTKINNDVVSIISSYLLENKKSFSFDLRELTGMIGDIWSIIFSYLSNDGEYVNELRMCRQCGKVRSNLFLTSCFPFFVGALSFRMSFDRYRPQKILLCDGSCAWKFMVNNLTYHTIRDENYCLVPCVKLVEKINRVHSNGYELSTIDLFPTTVQPLVLATSCVVYDYYLRFPGDYEYFVSQQIYSLVHQENCKTECWTYLPKRLILLE